MALPRRFCLVTSAHVSNNPRLVKEADALLASGADVRVVSLATVPALLDVDRQMAVEHGWRLVHVDGSRMGTHQARWIARAALQVLAARMFDRGLRWRRVADMAASRMSRELASAAAGEPSDVVIGHTLAALPAAGIAARRRSARLGFDAEDLHAEEASKGHGDVARRTLATAVESHWLPRCDYVTASSPGIADELAARYDIARPQVILNAFPRAMRQRRTSVVDRSSSHPTLYWYSQTIGPDRGIGEALNAMAGLPFPIELHLRGEPDAGYAEHLSVRATELGLRDRVVIHAPAPAEEMVAIAAQHDIGLAAEQPVCLNRLLCATNKLFTYLLAGNAIAATDTPGQRDILAASPGAAILYAHGDVDSLRAGLWSMLASPERLARAREASLKAALSRFSWEHEAPRLLAYLGGARGGVASSAGADR